MKVGLGCPESFRKRGIYVVDTLFDILGIPYRVVEEEKAELDLYWGPLHPEVKSRITIPLVSPEKWEGEGWEVVTIDEVPVLYVGEKPERLYYENEQIVLGFDILSPFFFLLSRYEEYANPRRDEFGRFRARDSALSRLNLLETPVLNIYSNLLREVFDKCGLPAGEPLWPKGKRFAVALSHDVDIPRKTIPGSLRIFFNQLLGNRELEGAGAFSQLGSVVDLLREKLRGGENPYWNFSKWTQLENGYGFKSCFYLFCQKRGEAKDPKYDLRTDRSLREAVKKFLLSGFEVGLHGSFKSAKEISTLKEEKSLLEGLFDVDEVGIRLHYLKIEVASSWRIQEEAGLVYDTTLGYPDEVGFRCGLAFPFRPYDLEREKRLNILELPLSIMDGAVFGKGRKDEGEVLSRCLQLLERVERGKGLAVILWHQRSWYERDFPGWRWVYEQILSYLSEKEAWVTSPGEIAKWWKKRSESVPTE